MAAYTKKPVQYYELSKTAGTINVHGLQLQLCDHLQKIDNDYYASALYEGEAKSDGQDKLGIYYRLIQDTPLAFIPVDLLKQAQAVYDDEGQTQDMLARVIASAQKLNNDNVAANQRDTKAA